MEKEQRIETLLYIVKIQYVNDNKKEMADYLADLFAKYDIETQQVEYDEGRSNLIAVMGKTKVKN